MSQDCEKCRDSPFFMFGEPLLEEQFIVLESKPLCRSFCVSRFVTRQDAKNEGWKSGKMKRLIVSSGKNRSLHHRMVT